MIQCVARSIFRTWLFLALACSYFAVYPEPAHAECQRMRVPAGVHRIRSMGGEIATIRAYCLDYGLPAPTADERLRPAVSSLMQVRRWPRGHPDEVEERPLAEVAGTWLEIRGNSTDTSLDVTILEVGYEYELHVDGEAPGVLGEPLRTSDQISTHADQLAKVLAESPAENAMQSLEEYQVALDALFGEDSEEATGFRMRTHDPGLFPGLSLYHVILEFPNPRELVADFIRNTRETLATRLGESALTLPVEDFCWTASLGAGRALTKEQLSAVSIVLQLERPAVLPDGLEEGIEQFNRDVADLDRVLQSNELDSYRQYALPGVLVMGRYSHDTCRRFLLYRLGLEPEAEGADAISIAYALHLGRKPDQQENEIIEQAFGVQMVGVFPNGIDIAIEDMASMRALFAESEMAETTRGYLTALLAEMPQEVARRRASQCLLDAHFPMLRGTRNSLALADVLYPETFSAAQTELLNKWQGERLAQLKYVNLAIVLSVKDGTEPDAAEGQKVRIVGDGLDVTVRISELLETLRSVKNSRRIFVDKQTFQRIVRDLPDSEAEELSELAESLESFLKTERQLAFESSREGDVLVQRYINSDPASQLRVEIVRLKGKKNVGVGDAIIVQFPDGKVLLIDTGYDAEGLRRIEERLRAIRALSEMNGTRLRIDILITHEDRDHINGLSEMLARIRDESDQGIDVGNIIFGYCDSSKPVVKKMLNIIKKTKYDPEDISPNWCIGRSREGDTLRTERSEDECVSILRVWGLRDVMLTIYQARDPGSTNDASLVVRLEHNGVSQLFTGDIGVAAMEALMASSSVALEADILKWPHHRSLPASWSLRDRDVLRRFLQRVSPHTIEISNAGARQPATNLGEIVEFAHKALDDPDSGFRVRVRSTEGYVDPDDGSDVLPDGSDGHLGTITLNTKQSCAAITWMQAA